MGFEVVEAGESLYVPGFIRKIKCHTPIEEEYIKQIVNNHNKKDTKIYFLVEATQDDIYGFAALSASRLERSPVLSIDYIFVSKDYRKTKFAELNNRKASEYLMDFSITIALEVKKLIAIRYIIPLLYFVNYAER